MNATLPQSLNHLHSALRVPNSELSPRRKGKIARLPKATRDMINRMLEDNLPYHVIIDELGELGEGLNPQNLTNWVQGGYQDYLQHQAAIDRVRVELEFATDLLKETENADPTLIHRATNLIAATQLFDAVRKYGDEALKHLLQSNPAKYLSMLDTIATMAHAGVKLEKQRLRAEAQATLPLSSQIKPVQGSQPVVEVRFQRAGEGGFQPPVPPAPASTQIKADQACAQHIAPIAPNGSAARSSEFKVTSSTFKVTSSTFKVQGSGPESVPSIQINPNQASAHNTVPIAPYGSDVRGPEFQVLSSTFAVQGSPAQPESAPSTQIKPDQASARNVVPIAPHGADAPGPAFQVPGSTFEL